MSKKLLTFLAFAFLISSSTIFAQSKTVKGTVTDATTGGPLPGVSVVLKGTITGTSSDFDGIYSIDIPSEGTLVFSAIGFSTQEIATNGNTTIDIVMQEDAEQLGEVVVTALGIKREAKAIGYAMSEVPGEELAAVKYS